ncbi:5-carboxymethyl-2-hydroxymuconate isomerase [Mycolicibacterium novocastrense]|uniref:fumarylacetoacetate hydrolase family protein n=1 Tax=Mycolicibacterium novocastrense TaxID=59813 RepID=UPI0007499C16|nr:fumarylacetoacetate hydrolase family protein [Mycolicibacterium novocastrense]KUH69810.1 5-carboxymethyl-2-hydroxymuconate isomerase [Mycolicibacterium novocastrense]KUH71359.1 5-carboxymethyl-2-hydroxymuconate isomerase [Mycolicibacterium novocastrense]KUH74423.1 5-carboxymethyl-2-hydroxymuconate isomerase [Mycolicibacterium novocastrense]
MSEYRRLLIDGDVVEVARRGDDFVSADGTVIHVDNAIHLPPCEPSKIICLHLGYWSRIHELSINNIKFPSFFHKPVSCLNAHGGIVLRPQGCQYLNFEGEIAVVIGRTTRGISPAEAKTHIAGYTIANDFGLHDFREADSNSMLRVKGSDSLGVVGPGLVPDWDPHDRRIRTLVNGLVVQEDSTLGMVWDFNYLVADVARTITLERGDLILTGTPANSRPVRPGDEVTVQVDGLGELACSIGESARVLEGFGAMPADSDAIRGLALGTGLATPNASIPTGRP